VTSEAIRGLADLEAKERERCANIATKAVAAGLAERQVRLAERHGELLAQVIRGVLDELGLSAEQRQLVPEVVRRHLIAVGSRSVVSAGPPSDTEQSLEHLLSVGSAFRIRME
jgi:hypothetical protein